MYACIQHRKMVSNDLFHSSHLSTSCVKIFHRLQSSRLLAMQLSHIHTSKCDTIVREQIRKGLLSRLMMSLVMMVMVVMSQSSHHCRPSVSSSSISGALVYRCYV